MSVGDVVSGSSLLPAPAGRGLKPGRGRVGRGHGRTLPMALGTGTARPRGRTLTPYPTPYWHTPARVGMSRRLARLRRHIPKKPCPVLPAGNRRGVPPAPAVPGDPAAGRGAGSVPGGCAGQEAEVSRTSLFWKL